MASSFHSNTGEIILYRSQPNRKWYDLAWRIGLEFFEIIIFILFSIFALTEMTRTLLLSILPNNLATGISRVLFEGISPVLAIAWFGEDIARIFLSELVLTNQRIWTKGLPYAWASIKEIPLSDIRSITPRRDALFIHRRSARKITVYNLQDGEQVFQAFTQIKQDA